MLVSCIYEIHAKRKPINNKINKSISFISKSGCENKMHTKKINTTKQINTHKSLIFRLHIIKCNLVSQ